MFAFAPLEERRRRMVADEHAPTAHMERLMQRMGQGDGDRQTHFGTEPRPSRRAEDAQALRAKHRRPEGGILRRLFWIRRPSPKDHPSKTRRDSQARQ